MQNQLLVCFIVHVRDDLAVDQARPQMMYVSDVPLGNTLIVGLRTLRSVEKDCAKIVFVDELATLSDDVAESAHTFQPKDLITLWRIIFVIL